MYFPGIKSLVQGDIPFLDGEVPAANGVVTGRGLAKMYAALANGGAIDRTQFLLAVGSPASTQSPCRAARCLNSASSGSRAVTITTVSADHPDAAPVQTDCYPTDPSCTATTVVGFQVELPHVVACMWSTTSGFLVTPDT